MGDWFEGFPDEPKTESEIKVPGVGDLLLRSPKMVLDIVQTIGNVLALIIKTGIGLFWDNIIVPIKGDFVKSYQELTHKEDAIWDDLFTVLKEGGLLTDRELKLLPRFKSLPGGFQTLFNFALLLNWMKIYIGSTAEITQAETVHGLKAEFTPNLPPVASLVQSGFIAPEKITVIRSLLQKHGFNEEAIDFLFLANYRLYDPQTVMLLFHRKVLTEEQMFERMREMGFTDTRIKEIKETWALIPPVQDILTMVAKEAFEPDQISRYGLDQEFPEEQSEWLTKQGLSRFWQEKYWAAHWDYPGPGQVLEMLHRGLIDEEGVSEYYRVVEMPKFWRDLLMKISYHPYTRVDTRRMHQMGVLSDEDLIKAYMDQGYDREHAEKMAEFTKRYNSDDSKKLTQSKILGAYKDDLISADDVRGLLQNLKFSEDQIEFLISMEDFDKVQALQKYYLSAIQKRYVSNLMDDVQARAELGKLNIPGAKTEALLTLWSTDKMIDIKMPSKTDLDKFLRNKIINEDSYKIEMGRLGYTFEQVDWYLKLIKLGKAGT